MRRIPELLRAFIASVAFLTISGAPRSAEAEEPRSAPAMSAGQAIALGLIEGLTEYLPISSTGHLFVAERLMGLAANEREQSVSDSFGIAIQLGAILAVVGLYFGRIRSIVFGLIGRDPEGLRLASRLLLAFVPAAAIALCFQKWIRGHLFGSWPIVAAWAVGGAAILLIGGKRRGRSFGALEMADIGARAAVWIGLAQSLALWPGVSRSLVTIAGGLLAGLKPRAAVEFSFLLGLVTLGAASSLEIVKEGGAMIELFGWWRPLLGLAVALVSAWASMRWMVAYLQRHSFAIFGWYRLAIAALTAGLILLGRLPA